MHTSARKGSALGFLPLSFRLLLPLGAFLLFLLLASPASAAEAGLFTENGKTYYRQEDGSLLTSGSIQIGKYLYTFKASGVLKKKARVYKAKWILQDGKYYWRRTNGKILQRTGMVTLKGAVYYINPDHSRYSGFQTVKGKLYYFREKNGKRLAHTGWKKIGKKTYYFLKNHSAAVGKTKIEGNEYYFDEKGALVTNERYYKIDGKYYHISKKGVLSPVIEEDDGGFYDGSSSHGDPYGEDDNDGYDGYDDEDGGYDDEDEGEYSRPSGSGAAGMCYALAEDFVERHAPSGSAYDRYYTCFKYMLSHQTFVVRPASFYDFGGTDWAYHLAINFLESGLVGDCHGFACAVAAVGSVLGYSPTVVVTAQDHSYVVIGGRYLDNMGPQFFSTESHAQYRTTYTASF